MDRPPRVKNSDRVVARRDPGGPCDGIAFGQSDPILIDRQAVELRTMQAGEPFKAVERACFFESFSKAGERDGRREATGRAALAFFGMCRMRGAVCAKEIAWVAGGCGLHQRFAMVAAFHRRV